MKDYFNLTIKNLRHRRLRSWLTMLGIFIGIAAVVSLISLGQGLQAAVMDEVQEAGADKIMILPLGSEFGLVDRPPGQLTLDDLDVVRRVSDVEEASFYTMRIAQVEWGRRDLGFYPIIGVPMDQSLPMLEEAMTIRAIDGRLLRAGDTRRAFIGYDYAHHAGFDHNLGPGDRFTVNGVRYEAIGINRRIGNEIDDRMIVIPYDDFEDLFDTGREVSALVAQARPNRNPGEVALQIEDAMRRDRNQRPGQEDFEVNTFEDLFESFLEIFQIVQGVVIGIASISLLVGGIGIMNTMYTSVLERRREIGIMKSIGARNENIYTIFLLESGLLGLIGGIIGVLLGIFFAKAVEFVGAVVVGTPLLQAQISIPLIVGALLFSFFIGVISGLLPARQAARMNPIDALRTE